MTKLIRRLSIVAVILISGVAAFLFAARAGWLTPNDAALSARYELAESQFVTIDGQAVHFTDQGQGPAVVLMHGTFGSLRNWDEWVEALSPRYRVIRFDRPRMGLSGPAPVGRAGSEQELRILEALTNALGVKHFFLVATSSAGGAGAAFAASHPERVRGLILSNIAVGPYTGRSERSATLRFLLTIDPWLNGWRSQEFWRQVLLINFENDEKVTDDLAREWSELNNRVQRMPPATFQSLAERSKQTIEDLRRMSVPTLLLWSDNDHERPVEIVGRYGFEVLASADKNLEIVAGCGHIMPLDCGSDSAHNAIAFFDRLIVPEVEESPNDEQHTREM